MKIFEVMDGDVEKKFIIRKFKATKSFVFLNNLLSLFKDSEDFNAYAIKQFIYIAIESGIKVPESTKENVDKIIESFSENPIALFYRIFKSITSTWTEEEQERILSQALQCILFMQSANSHIELNTVEGDACHIDLYVMDVQTIYKLLWEVLEVNYSSFFSGHVM